MSDTAPAEFEVGRFVDVRRDLHAYPELSRRENRTARVIADLLGEWGDDVICGVGGHGVVGVLRRGKGGRSVAVRADIDALPILDESGLPHASTVAGVMHACGHDGHAAILLAAAFELSQLPALDGTFVAIFQPADETGLGAKAILSDGLLERAVRRHLRVAQRARSATRSVRLSRGFILGCGRRC